MSRTKDNYDDKYIVLYNLNAIYEAIGAQLMFKLQNILYRITKAETQILTFCFYL